VRLLQTAFDAGITHFDTARCYGYGEAEVAVGDLLAAVGRDRVTIATKFGILAPRRTPVLMAAKAAARLVASAHPSLGRLVNRRAQGMVRTGTFDVASATASLEASLRALRTDHVELLLLHECELEDMSDDILAFLDRARRDGKILAHGIATRPAPTRDILMQRGEAVPVVQVADGIVSPQLPQLPLGATPATAVITHSALGPQFAALRSRLAGDPVAARHWSGRLGFDAAGDGQRLAGLFLAAAVSANPRGAVLFSSTQEANIRANAAAAGNARALAAARSRIEALHALIHPADARAAAPLHAPAVPPGSRGA
jgi:aryl-alcohol dehydrogenase-like predicted oxidoreductase